MPLTCNIDSKGRAIRLAIGIVWLVLGVLLVVFWALPSMTVWPWIISLLGITYGAFGIFEGWAGWCVVRAMGFKTRI